MYARVTTIQGAPGKMDDATGHIQEQTLPQLQKMEGFKGFVALGDRQSGKVLGVAFWESEEALRATDEAVSIGSLLIQVKLPDHVLDRPDSLSNRGAFTRMERDHFE